MIIREHNIFFRKSGGGDPLPNYKLKNKVPYKMQMQMQRRRWRGYKGKGYNTQIYRESSI
jgi:hypothetical protein